MNKKLGAIGAAMIMLSVLSAPMALADEGTGPDLSSSDRPGGGGSCIGVDPVSYQYVQGVGSFVVAHAHNRCGVPITIRPNFSWSGPTRCRTVYSGGYTSEMAPTIFSGFKGWSYC